MTNKTISINPSLFSTGGSKTKKLREKKQRPNTVPLISPNVLKTKLLKRIKEHKTRETENLENNKKNITEENKPNKTHTNISDFSDEFNDSINYLETLSKQKKINAEKEKYELSKQKKREEIQRSTIKNYQSVYNVDKSIMPHINIDLPEELKESLINITTEQLKHTNNLREDPVPYGVLKGGVKPTYRDWSKTQRNLTVTNPNSSLIIQDSSINKTNTDREMRLNNLKDKLKQKQKQEEIDNVINKVEMDNVLMTQNLIQKPQYENNDLQTLSSVTTSINNSNNLINQNNINNTISNTQKNTQPIVENIVVDMNTSLGIQNKETKKFIKKTIKKKYTLGRSKIKKTVAILLKDRGTRKKVLTAQRDLKRKPLNDIKTYLRDHNLIKIGSNAPNDVLRKIYETSMLAGEITNNNKETMLHNLSKNDKEL